MPKPNQSRRRVTKKKPSGGLTKWFKEEWVDVKTGKPCGRKSAKKSERPGLSIRPQALAVSPTRVLWSIVSSKAPVFLMRSWAMSCAVK